MAPGLPPGLPAISGRGWWAARGQLLYVRAIRIVIRDSLDILQTSTGYLPIYDTSFLQQQLVTHRARLLVTSLGKESIILGLPWLRCMNAQINWKSGKIEFEGTLSTTPLVQKRPKTTVEDVQDEDAPQAHPACTVADVDVARPVQEPEPPREPVPTELPEFDDPDMEPDDLLLAYIHGEPVVGIFDRTQESPLTKEHLDASDLAPPLNIRCTTPWRDSTRFSFSQSRWIHAKINLVMEMAQRQYAEEGPKTTESTIPAKY